jgi:hypothetical protein
LPVKRHKDTYGVMKMVTLSGWRERLL